MRLAIESAGLDLEDIDYINAHGTSTYLNDKSETTAIKTLFGEQAYKIPVSSTKSMTGHLLGASGALEAVFCSMAIMENMLPPTINYETPDPVCDLDLFPNQPRKAEPGMSCPTHLGFGGHNATLVISRFNREGETMPFAHITGWGMYVPEPVLTNDDISKLVDTSDEWIRDRTGIRERHIARETDFPSTMGVEAAIRALKVANLAPTDLDLIICTSSSPEYIFPPPPALFKIKLARPKLAHLTCKLPAPDLYLHPTWARKPFAADR